MSAIVDTATAQKAFVVSARKYRPSTFSTVVGQQHITSTLKNAIAQNHLAQAFLFCGPRGVGKTTCARILAKAINCTNRSADAEPCNNCHSCNSFNAATSFNIHELDAASNNSVEDIRALVDQVRYPPVDAQYKVYIIDEVHMLSTAAFNAFLKTLEEPPSYAIFILATTEKHKILPTILSRCQIFDFSRIKIADIVEQLKHVAQQENIPVEDEALHIIGQKADGGMRDALSMFDLVATFSQARSITYASAVEHLNVLDYDYYFRLIDALYQGDTSGTLLIYDEILRKGFDGHLFISGLAEHLRNLMVSNDPRTVKLLQVPESAQQRFLDQAKRIDRSFQMSALALASTADGQYKTTRNHRLLVELALMKMCYLREAIDLAQLSRQPAAPAAGEKKNSPASIEVTASIAAPSVSLNGGGGALKSTRPQDLSASISAPQASEPSAVTLPRQRRDASFDTANASQAQHALEQHLRQQERLREASVVQQSTWSAKGQTLVVITPGQLNFDTLKNLLIEKRFVVADTLQNDAFELGIELGQTQVDNGPSLYSDSDKLTYLLEQYPGLAAWRQALALDLA